MCYQGDLQDRELIPWLCDLGDIFFSEYLNFFFQLHFVFLARKRKRKTLFLKI